MSAAGSALRSGVLASRKAILASVGAAFFDLDRTLISGSSTFHFAVAGWRHDLLSWQELAGGALHALLFRLTGASDERSAAMRDRLLSSVEGANEADLLEMNERVIPRVLERVRPEAKGLLELHAEADRDRYLVSASPTELVTPLASALGLEGGIGTRSEVVNGHYTGRLDGPFVYGDGKAQAIRKLAAERDYDLRVSYAYSDSASDLPMLEMVGHPVAVNPDRALAAVAHQRGWPVVTFSRRTKRNVKRTTAAVAAGTLAAAAYVLGQRHGRRRAARGGLLRALA